MSAIWVAGEFVDWGTAAQWVDLVDHSWKLVAQGTTPKLLVRDPPSAFDCPARQLHSEPCVRLLTQCVVLRVLVLLLFQQSGSGVPLESPQVRANSWQQLTSLRSPASQSAKSQQTSQDRLRTPFCVEQSPFVLEPQSYPGSIAYEQSGPAIEDVVHLLQGSSSPQE